MFIEEMRVARFRHLSNVTLGPFRAPAKAGELIVLAGQNGGGKSSVLELLALGLAHRYSYQYYAARQMADYSFALKIGLTSAELAEITADSNDPTVVAFVTENRGYWTQINLPEALGGRDPGVNERVHSLASIRFQSFERKLGFFIRSDRSYAARNYNRNSIFDYRNRAAAHHITSLSYKATNEQYADMYDFLVEQSYHHVYELGTHFKNQQQGKASIQPADPLTPYNNLLGRLFPGYSFVDVSVDDLSLRVRLPSGEPIPFHDLSSGEKEVFFILAFFIRHSIANSVIVVDEPELHLHPDLSRKFVRLMRSIMPGNQIWSATHSAELVDEAGRERAFFVRRKPEIPRNAEVISATSEESELQLLRDLFGQSGYIGISRKLVFTEGEAAGADRKTFSNLFPEFAEEVKIIPAGSSTNLQRINRAIMALLAANIAQCEFYLVRDRDYMSDVAVAKQVSAAPGKLFVLERHEIENYLLDEDVICDVLTEVYQKPLSRARVRDHLLDIARDNSGAFLRDMVTARYAELFQNEDCSVGKHSNGVPVVDAMGTLDVGRISPLRAALQAKLLEIGRVVASRTTQLELDRIFDECSERIRTSLDSGSDVWKVVLPGKELLQQFSKSLSLGEWPALQNLIIERMAEANAVPAELTGIFRTISGPRS